MSLTVDMPGDLPGWKRTWFNDFDTPAAEGQFLSVYTDLDAYGEGWPTSSPWRTGRYSQKYIRAENSCAISHIATVKRSDGTWPRVSALLPKLSMERPYGVLGGRFSMCMRADSLPGYKLVPLLWPDDGNRGTVYSGEIDWPETNERYEAHGFMHPYEGGTQSWVKAPVNAFDGAWHVWTTVWRPGRADGTGGVCRFDCDGVSLGRFTSHVPISKFHWVWQIEPLLRVWQPPDPAVAGDVEVDWATYHTAG